MNPLVLLILGTVLIFAGVGMILWLVKRGTFEPDATNTDTAAEREELRARDRADEWTVPLRRRYKTLPGAARIMIVVMAVLVVLLVAVVYRTLQAGRPLTALVDYRVAAGSLALLGVVAGVRVERSLRDRVRRAYVAYESEGGEPAVEVVPFMAGDREYRDGEQIVKEVASSRLFGLVWRYRQVAERRGLRESDSLPEDIVEHLIPDHAWETPDGNVVIRTREGGDEVLADPAQPDKAYSSPRQLSREESIKLREERRRIRAELNNVKATNAELMRQIRTLRKQLKNREYQEREDLIDELGEVLEQFAPLVNDQFSSNQSTETRPDPAEVVKNRGADGD